METHSEFEREVFNDILDWGSKYLVDFLDLSGEELTKLYWAEYLKD